MILTALDKINILVNKVNKLDARIRKKSKCNSIQQINENDNDDIRNSTDTLDSEHPSVMGHKFIEGVITEQTAIPKQYHINPIDLNHGSPIIIQMIHIVKKWWNKFLLSNDDIDKIIQKEKVDK